MTDLNTDVRYIKGVGEARAKALSKLGIFTLRDLVSFFPRGYDDRSVIKDISSLIFGESVCVRGIVASEPRLSRIRKGLDILKLRVVDEGCSLNITYFNQSYLKNTFKTGESYIFYGKVAGKIGSPEMTNPVFEKEGNVVRPHAGIPGGFPAGGRTDRRPDRPDKRGHPSV